MSVVQEFDSGEGSVAQLKAALSRRERELAEAHEREAASADILRLIAGSPDGAQPVFDAIVRSGAKLFPGAAVTIGIPEGDKVVAVAISEPDRARAESWRSRFPVPLTRNYLHGVCILDANTVDIPDVAAATLSEVGPGARNFLASGYHAITMVPLVRNKSAIGALSVVRPEPGPISKGQLALLKAFAAQAVIAIENTQLVGELRESLAQQTATADVLKVISRSTFDLPVVLETLIESACRLCEAEIGTIRFEDGERYRLAATYGCPPEWNSHFAGYSGKPDKTSVFGQTIIKGRTVHIPDVLEDPEYSQPQAQKLMGLRAALGVPLVRDSRVFGVVNLFRTTPTAFTAKQIDLAETFADQAVIAIENVRLFEAEQRRAAELTESLEQQKATSEVLGVISATPGQLKSVFDTILINALNLCEANFGLIHLCEGKSFRPVAMHNIPPALAAWQDRAFEPRPDDPLGRMLANKRKYHIADVRTEQAYVVRSPPFVALVEGGGARTLLAVPLVTDGEVIGDIAIYRQEVREFSDKQIALVENFAAQAVIAIENARLLGELRESLAQQIATADVLKVISRSTFDLQIVLDTLSESVARLCEAYDVVLLLREGNRLAAKSHYGPIKLDCKDMAVDPRWVTGRAFLDRVPVQVLDLTTSEEFPHGRDMALRMGHRTILAVPLLRDNVSIGAFAVRRQETRLFTEKQIELLQTFADQAVIAIGNVRLFEAEQQRTAELAESLEQQTATSEVLQVISSSPGELQPVFKAMLESAVHICRAQFGVMHRFVGSEFEAVAMLNIPPELEEFLRRRGLAKAIPGSDMDHLTKSKQVIHTLDMLAAPVLAPPAKFGGARTQLAVPMLKDNELVGAFAIYRQEVLPFTDKQIELIKNFAAQAVIAIENGRLLSELRESLSQQTATADVLKVISRSTFDLQTVLDTLVESSSRLCEAYDSIILLRDGDRLSVNAHFGPIDVDFTGWAINRDWVSGRAFVDRVPVHIHDLTVDADFPDGRDMAARLGFYTTLSVPLLREDEAIGVITIRRKEVKPFTDKQIELVETFADQAVIAIENARLFEAEQQRTAELAESLGQQTATSEVLQVISSSPGELQPVFDTMLAKATELCEAGFGTMWLLESDGRMRTVALHGKLPDAYRDLWGVGAVTEMSPSVPSARAIHTGRAVHVADLRQHAGYLDGDPLVVSAVDISGVRSLISIPMVKDKTVIGAIAIYRREVKPFTDKQIELVTNFAAQAVIAIENTRLLSELRESLAQQTATSEVLEVVSSSPGELDPVFEAMLENATRICEAKLGCLFLLEGDSYRAVAVHGESEYADWWRRDPVVDMSVEEQIGTPLHRLMGEKALIHIHDLRLDRAYLAGNPRLMALVESAGARTHLVVPMLKDEHLIGAIVIYRLEVRPFSDKQIALVQNFAAQAVIAIENTRLLKELRQRTEDLTESLAQQTATADVLSVMSRSKFDLGPVLQSVADTAARLCRADQAVIFRLDDGLYRFAAGFSLVPEYLEAERAKPIAPGPGTAVGRAAAERRAVRIEDAMSDPTYAMKEQAAIAQLHSMIGVPLLRDGEPIGVIALARCRVEPFSDREIELVSTFADQAVIAIENVRLFDELQTRTNDLQESLQQQTATADVLKTISRSTFDLQTVLYALAESAKRLCLSDQAYFYLLEGSSYRLAASCGFSQEAEALLKRHTIVPGRNTLVARTSLEGKIVHIVDVLADPEYTYSEAQKLIGFRSLLGVPLMREGTPIGVMTLSRGTVQPFTQKQIDLVSTFADQAVIAIENVRLFDEVQARTEDLQESLQQQTATAEVLKTISRSTFDLMTVLDTLLKSAARLCDADHGTITQRKGSKFYRTVAYGYPNEFLDYVKDMPVEASRNTGTGRALFEGKVIHIPDVEVDNEYTWEEAKRLAKFRTMLGVPMLREGEPVGVLTLTRTDVRPFTDKQIELVTTFADQAAIAIENVRLFDEVQARTEELTESLQQQTATADVLKVISRSAFDLTTVLQTLVESAARLCDADKVNITREKNGAFYRAEGYGFSQEFQDYVRDVPIRDERGSGFGRALLEDRVIHIPDVLADPDYTQMEMQRLGDYRTVLAIPMMREGATIGVLTLTRSQVRPFNEKQIDLATTFADQAAIAIENVRLFDEIQEKSHQLEEASKHKSQFLANMSHELRTPLNAILGYTELIADGVYGETPEKVQATIKRIMANGKHLLGLINDVLDLSKIEAGQLTLSLADYSMKDIVHNVFGAVEPLALENKLTFKAEIAPDLPRGYGDERRLTQVLLNLVGNAIKFTDKGSVVIKAALKDGMFSVAVVDTGPGISEDDQKKLFQEFQQADSSTTKKKGGTGLGLAISKRIIEMHGGKVWLESRVSVGSTFGFMIPVHAEQQKRAAT